MAENNNSDLVFKLRNGKLEEKDIAELVKRALEERNEESYYLLKVREWDEVYERYESIKEVKIIYGNAEKILINEEYNYDEKRKEREYIIIPKDRLVILLDREYVYSESKGEREALTVFVFTGDGWHSHTVSEINYF
jgi:hypothetical protein